MSEKVNLKVSRIANDTEYYANVFKKTEKIVSVIFYILSESKTDTPHAVHYDTITQKALALHETLLTSLTLRYSERGSGLFAVQHALVALESTLRIADAAQALAPELTRVLYPELDAVERYLKHHYLDSAGLVYQSETPSAAPVGTTSASTRSHVPSTPRPAAPRRVMRSQIPAGDISTDAVLVYSQLTDRAERIKTVLEAKPEATIKDLSEVITDVSEKTIQRELNSLIEKGQVIRQGERRWSKYSLAPS